MTGNHKFLELDDKYLQDKRFMFITDSQEIEHICSHLGDIREDPEDVTGALVDVGDGDYNEVWLTTWRAPWNLSSWYFRAL